MAFLVDLEHARSVRSGHTEDGINSGEPTRAFRAVRRSHEEIGGVVISNTKRGGPDETTLK